MRKKLIIVKNKLNDKGSHLYLKQIRKQWRELYQDSIELLTYQIDDMDTLSDVICKNQDAKFLLLTPTDLYLSPHKQGYGRNAEHGQTAMYVCDKIRSMYTQENTSILVIGGIEGNVSGRIAIELMRDKYGVMLSGSRLGMTPELTQNFDVVVNCVPQDKKIEIHVCCDSLFDVSGNFKPMDKPIIINYSGDKGYIPSVIDTKFDIGEIGSQTTWRMLEEVKNG